MATIVNLILTNKLSVLKNLTVSLYIADKRNMSHFLNFQSEINKGKIMEVLTLMRIQEFPQVALHEVWKNTL